MIDLVALRSRQGLSCFRTTFTAEEIFRDLRWRH